MAHAGVDSIKFELSGNDIDGPDESARLLFTDDEVAAIGAQAAESQVWLSCHAQAAGSIKQAIRHGFRVLYHCTLADDEALDLLEAHRDSIFVAPAPGLPYSRIHEATAFGIDRDGAERLGAFDSLNGMIRVCPELHKRGVRVLPGGDYGFPYNPIGRNARDLALFVTLFGFTPIEALVAATRYGGELMDLPVGQIRAGYLADLLLVDGDPTIDITVLQDPTKLLAIMKGATSTNRHPTSADTPPRGTTSAMANARQQPGPKRWPGHSGLARHWSRNTPTSSGAARGNTLMLLAVSSSGVCCTAAPGCAAPDWCPTWWVHPPRRSHTVALPCCNGWGSRHDCRWSCAALAYFAPAAGIELPFSV